VKTITDPDEGGSMTVKRNKAELIDVNRYCRRPACQRYSRASSQSLAEKGLRELSAL
jgi:hypothetical protein